MSSGAELAIIAAPVAGVAVIAGAALFLAAGVVVAGGVALVGVGRLGVAAGSYVNDRLRERAQLCAGEYARFQQLRAIALATQAKQGQSPAARVTGTRTAAPEHARRRFHENPRIAEEIAAHLSADLSAQQARYAEQLQLIERRANLAALLALDGGTLSPEIDSRARQALATGDITTLSEAISAIQRVGAQIAGEALQQEQAALRAHQADIAGLLAVVTEPPVRDELLSWQIQLNRIAASSDIEAIRNRLRTGADLVARCRMQHETALTERREKELAEVCGLLQAVGGLLLDLQSMQSAKLLVIDETQMAWLKELGARYERLEIDPSIELSTLRAEVRAIKAGLHALEQDALRQLNGFYQQRLADEVEQSLHEIQLDGTLFDKIERTTQADGTLVLKARQGKRRLNVRVRPNARIKYEAHGFGDEGCLDAVYQLLDRLIERGVQIEVHHPTLTPQVDVALRVVEAMKQLGHYQENEITVREDVDALIIEASKTGGPAFQRQQISVDDQGNLREQHERGTEQSGKLTGAKDFTAAYDQAANVVQKKVKRIRERHPAVEQQLREQQERL